MERDLDGWSGTWLHPSRTVSDGERAQTCMRLSGRPRGEMKNGQARDRSVSTWVKSKVGNLLNQQRRRTGETVRAKTEKDYPRIVRL